MTENNGIREGELEEKLRALADKLVRKTKEEKQREQEGTKQREGTPLEKMAEQESTQVTGKSESPRLSDILPPTLLFLVGYFLLKNLILHDPVPIAERYGQDSTAKQQSERIVQEEKLTYHQYVARADKRREQRDFTGSLQDYNEALRLIENDWKPEIKIKLYYKRGTVMFAMEDYRHAENDFGRAVSGYSTKYADIKKEIRAYERRGENWIDHRNTEFSTKLNLSQCYYSRGLARERRGKLKEAEDDYTHAIRLSGFEAQHFLRRALVRKQLGDSSGAAEDFEEYKTFR